MAPFIPRQRKHKVRQRLKSKPYEGSGVDANVLELPSSTNQKDEKRKAIKNALRAEQPKMSSRKQKRLDNYIVGIHAIFRDASLICQDKKLRKEETIELIKKLESAKVDTHLLRSSRDLGLSKNSKGQLLRIAPKEREGVVDVDDSNDSISESEVSDHPLETTTESGKQQSKSQQPPRVVLGSGLKRRLDANTDGQPFIKKRKCKGTRMLQTFVVDDDEIPWEGFSSTGDLSGTDEASNLSMSSVGTQTGSETDLSESLGGRDHEHEQANDLEDKPKLSVTSAERSSAFKAWATQQVNEALGFQPSVNSAQTLQEQPQKAAMHITPREAESDPLPPELSTKGAVQDRKAYSVRVERVSEIQEARMQLPVVAEEQKIMEAIYNNPTVVIWGATGSGKTTQVPQFLYEAGFGTRSSPTPGMIGVTQPRRVAAVSMAKRVSDELGGVQGKVSYQIRFDSSVSDKTAIKFMTDGILIREIANDFALLRYSVIIVDEAHERSANTDILIGMVSRIVDLRASMSKEDPKVTPLKFVIMSATLRVSDFIENPNLFKNGTPPVVQAEGRQFPVTVHFARRTQRDYVDEVFHKVSRGHKKLPPGGMLVFLTGQNEITALARRLKEDFVSTSSSHSACQKVTIAASEAPLEADDVDFGNDPLIAQGQSSESEDTDGYNSDREFEIEDSPTQTSSSRIHVLPLYSQLQTKDQLRIFEPPPENARLIVLATNVAETSLTIPGIRYVFDCGRAKEKKYDRVTGVQSFEIGWISKASASQRTGRAGRTGPGHCYRLYSSAVYERDFEEHAEPEILRMPVEGIVLQLKSMDLQHVVNFPFPTPPDRHNLAKAEKLLTYLGALSSTGKITSVGLELSTYPLSPRFSKMLAIGHQQACLPYTVAMVAALAVPDIFIPENQLDLSVPIRNSDAIFSTADQLADTAREQRKKDYNRAHGIFGMNSPTSDAIKVLSALCAYAYAPEAEAFAKEMFLNPKALKEASHLRQQLSKIVHDNHPAKLSSMYESRLPEPSSKQIRALQQILAAAFVDQIAIRADAAPAPPELPRKPTRAIDVPYLPLFKSHQGRGDDLTDVAVFIHPSSVLARSTPKELPEYVIYSQLQRGTSATIDGSKKPKTRMHALCTVTGKQMAALARETPLVEYGKPLGKMLELEGGKRECWVVPDLVGDKGGRRWPLPAQKVVQRREGREGWLVEKVLS